MDSDYRVILIVDRAYGEKLNDAPADIPIWIVKTEANYPVVQELWKSRVPAKSTDGITSFNDKPDASPEELAESMLETIDLHHWAWNVLTLIGARKNESLFVALKEGGFAPTEENDLNLEFRRESPLS